MRRNEELEFAVAELKRYNIRYDTRETNGGHIEIAWQVGASSLQKPAVITLAV
ncbi:anti-sigma regulatory factor (Ser/Thr protein kinase) [Bradyrhizobium sp. USDA 4341]